MKINYKKIGLLTGGLILAMLVWYFFIRTKVKPLAVITEKPVYGYIAQSVTATGKIEPVDTVTVGTQVSGIIKYLYVNYNSKVKKGELLAQLDKSLLQATLDQYRGILRSAESQLLYATSNYTRQNLLFKTDAISKEDYEIALNTYNLAKASVASAQAQVRLATKNLYYADIYSPIDGVVLNRTISVGQTVAASFNTPTLFIIAKDITKMEVEAAVNEADIGDVKAGNRASFTVDAFLNDHFQGIVREIRLHPAVSANVVTYTTIINTPNNDLKLKPGMTANIDIYTREVQHALLIPVNALTFRPDSSLMQEYQVIAEVGHRAKTGEQTDISRTGEQVAYVWLLKDRKLVKTPLTIGISDNIKVEILKGLTPNDLVVIGQTKNSEVKGTTSGSPFIPHRTGGRPR